ncbi:unnamed protein product [Cutaneotrichosporon oleaginosum]
MRKQEHLQKKNSWLLTSSRIISQLYVTCPPINFDFVTLLGLYNGARYNFAQLTRPKHHPRTSDASVQRQQREQPAHPNHPITRRYSLHSHTDHADSHTALPLTECASGPRDWLEIKIRSRNKRL